MPTPEEPGKPHERPVLEPIRVLRPRNTDALAELIREMTEPDRDAGAYEAIPLTPSAGGEAETEELPPVAAPTTTATPTPTTPRGGSDWASERGGPRPAPRRARRDPGVPRGGPAAPGRGAPAAARAARDGRTGARAARTDSDAGLRRGAIMVGVCAAALAGFAGALLLPGRGGEAAAETVPPSASAPASTPSVAATPSADPDGAGTLREGDSGPQVTDLQRRLLRIPNVYDHGPTDGRYSAVLTEAVARFQLWYGIRGDESGVYGDDTRRDLESRTGAHTG
ncbi:peptidoglycan-binding domain-containing protein [Streptomyces hilarionis]|uniref:peptidoglycan-binding domain-containing protein n=1 Tax=Streptomyces hilarionis TaxID=2839954 RepID=UPI00211A69A3|nr:peptidoglycan-binding domain-containing protein [Streptomyces hilarionis]MCQ9132979.1 peptidoglycan-binding protein [Streptomyces hilarionis]